MQLDELYSKLVKAYSDKNLNKITAKLIDIYKAKNYSSLEQLVKRISEYISIETDNYAKSFSQLVMLYHPDKGDAYRNLLKTHYQKNDSDKLKELSHIFVLNDIDTIKVTRVKKQEPVEDNSEYVWDNPEDGFEYYSDEAEDVYTDNYDDEDYYEGGKGYSNDEPVGNYELDEEPDKELTFYNAVKLREYGRLDIEFPPYYLEDFKEINFADSAIDSLDGIGYCKHAVSLDLSNNNIHDISELDGLHNIEELYLAENRIGYIDSISSLINLKILDISNNDIDDISPLYTLENLQFVNLLGNSIDAKQINRLRMQGIVVLC